MKTLLHVKIMRNWWNYDGMKERIMFDYLELALVSDILMEFSNGILMEFSINYIKIPFESSIKMHANSR